MKSMPSREKKRHVHRRSKRCPSRNELSPMPVSDKNRCACDTHLNRRINRSRCRVDSFQTSIRMSGRIALQLVSHKPAESTTPPFHQITEDPYRSIGITPVFDKYVDHVTGLADGAIEIILLSTNSHEHLVHMSGVPIPTIPTTQSSCLSRIEFRAPAPDHLHCPLTSSK